MIPLDKVLDVNAFDPKILEEEVRKITKDNHHSHDGLHDHKPSVTTYTLNHHSDCISAQAVEAWLGALVWEKSMEIYRIKGELRILDDEYRYIVQGVHDNFEITRSNFKWTESLPKPTDQQQSEDLDPKMNKIIFIGRNIDMSIIQASFEDSVIHKS